VKHVQVPAVCLKGASLLFVHDRRAMVRLGRVIRSSSEPQGSAQLADDSVGLGVDVVLGVAVDPPPAVDEPGVAAGVAEDLDRVGVAAPSYSTPTSFSGQARSSHTALRASTSCTTHWTRGHGRAARMMIMRRRLSMGDPA